MFKQGDAVVHPARGVGIVTSIEERQRRGAAEKYYKLELLDGLGTRVMIPVSAEDALGLRPGIKASQLRRVWRTLRAEPRPLPANYKERNRLVDERLASGDILDVAGVVRDLTTRERDRGELTTVTKRHLKRSLTMLSGEVAAALGIELEEAEAQVRARLRNDSVAQVEGSA
jgi:CarD family transcriptional regulator